MHVLKAILHLVLESGKLAVSWMGTTYLAVAVLATPFVGRLILAYRAERWTGVKKAIRSASKYTVSIWAILFIIGMGRFVYKDHSRLVAENKKLRMAATNTNTASSLSMHFRRIMNTQA
jgi:prolipoprotein diacylglyceryltransferase